MSRKKQKPENNSILKNSELMESRTKKMATPYIAGTLSVALVSLIDSLIAGRSIGSEALAAVAATAPLLSIGEILHCLLCFGVDKLMIQMIGKGDRKAANRIFGSVLVAIAVIFVLVFGLIIVFERPILSLMQIDPSLHDKVLAYSLPLLITNPLFEVFLCIERAFRVDGRAKLFASRGLITNVVNIALSLLFVTVMGFEIKGLAWASVIGTLLGYSVTLSHFFSKKRTVSPDFSVVLSSKENFEYLKKDIRLGYSATLDELAQGLLVLAQTSVISAVAGTNGLAAWAVFTTLYNIVVSIYNGISASVSLHSGLMIGEKNYGGVRASLMTGFKLEAAFGFAAALLLLFIPNHIAYLFCRDLTLIPLCTECLRIGGLMLPTVAMTVVMSAYLPSINKSPIAYGMIILQKGAFIVAAMIGYFFGFIGLIICFDVAGLLVAIIQNVIVFRDKSLFVPENDPELIRSYSITLIPRKIAEVCEDIIEVKELSAYGSHCAEKISLLVEECLNNILKKSNSKSILADIDIGGQDDGVFIRIVDDGSAYNPFSSMDKQDRIENDLLEEAIILGLTEDTTYDRVIDMNHITMFIRYPQLCDTAVQGV